MGMYDTIYVTTQCPICKEFTTLHGQTKDLTQSLFNYEAMPAYYLDSEENVSEFEKRERELRRELKTHPAFPYDKEYKVWNNQLEKIRNRAKIPTSQKNKKWINVYFECDSFACQKEREDKGKHTYFEANLRVREQHIIAELHDVEKKQGGS